MKYTNTANDLAFPPEAHFSYHPQTVQLVALLISWNMA